MLLFLIFLLLVLIIISITLWWCKLLYKYYVVLGHYSGPFPIPLIGSAHKFRNGEEFIANFHYYREKYGNDNFKLIVGNELRLIITEHKAAEELLTSTTILNKSYEYKFFYRWIGLGILTAFAENWKKQRKLLTTAFHFKILEKFVDVFNTQSNVMVKKLEQHLDGNPFDIFDIVGLCSLDMICETAMGIKVDAQNVSDSSYVKSVSKISTIIIERMFSPLTFFDPIYKLTDLYKQEVKTLDVLHSLTKTVIQQRKQQLETESNEDEPKVDEYNYGQKRKIAFLDLLLQSKVNGEHLPDQYIKDEVDTIMFEGHDTVSSGISFVLYCMGQHPEIQEKVMDELRTIFEDKHQNPSYQDLQNMKYLEMVVKETMRLYPPVTIFGRVLDEDTMFGGKLLPKGLSITIFINGLHKQPDMFPDPDKFDPERFSPENSSSRSAFAYVPFSAGSRNCIGLRYAMVTMKATVVAVLRNYEILPVEGHKPILRANVILTSANGLPIRLKKRKMAV